MSLPGKFSVGNSGAAVYQIPIALPPGTGGMSPSLTLDYNSQSGNGILGVGWSLSGLPVVDRCPRTFAQDGVRGAVNYDSNDRYCMDGQRLIAVSGAYGADGTEYRTELESFNRIISHGTAGNGPSWFEVRTKSGQIMEFGHTADSQILALGKTTARNWLVDKVSDTKGNYFTVSYTNDTVNGQAYPIEINYTGNATAGLAPYNKVQFVYASRSDIISAYHAGSLSQTTVRLTNVKAYASASLVANYGLTYEQGVATSRSRLKTVTLCAGDGACLPATNLSWQDGGVAFESPMGGLFNNWNWGTNTFSPVVGDVNGDGKADVVMLAPTAGGLFVYTLLSNGNGTYAIVAGNGSTALFDSSNWTVYSPTVGDVNGDGKADIVFAAATGSGLYLITLLSNGDGTYTLTGGNPSNGSALVSGGNWGGGYFPVSADVNGDGRADIVMAATTANGLYVNTLLSNGNGTYAVVAGNASTSLFESSNWTIYHPTGGDVNGDGKADLVFAAATGNGLYAYTLLSNGDGTFALTGGNPSTGAGLVSGGNWGGGYSPTCADVNGDGKTDVVLTAATVNGLYVHTLLSKGDGTYTLTGSALAGSGSWLGGYSPIGADVNGDGRADVVMVARTTSGLYAYTLLSNGDGTYTLTGGNSSTSAGLIMGGADWSGYAASSTDFDGDGKSDISLVQATTGGIFVYSMRAAGKSPDLLTSISSGLATTASFSYQPLTLTSIYTKDTTSVYPQLDLQGAMYVVSRVDANNGQGGNYSTAYSYAGAKVDLNGRGLLGFRQMKVTDLQTGLVETTNYLQSFPYIGLLASKTKTLSTLTLGQATSTYQFGNASNSAVVSAPSISSAPYRVSVAQSVTSGSDLDGTALPSTTSTFQYDAYGNATQVTAANSDGHSKTTINTYTNNATNWLLGRLTASTVTGQAP
jgi:hypothetical protein